MLCNFVFKFNSCFILQWVSKLFFNLMRNFLINKIKVIPWNYNYNFKLTLEFMCA